MDINSQQLIREEETGRQLDLLKKVPKKDFKGVNFSSVTWCGEKSRVIWTWVSRSWLQNCLPLAIFLVCKVAIMVLGCLAVVMRCI